MGNSKGGGSGMREILFRGKTKDGRWMYGDLVRRLIETKWQDILGKYQFAISGLEEREKYVDFKGKRAEVMKCTTINPATVGQYTGLCDKNGKKIFEGDKVESSCGEIGIIEYLEEDGMFIISFAMTSGHSSWIATFGDFEGNEMAVIGNIYDKEEQDALQGKFAQDGRCTFDE